MRTVTGFFWVALAMFNLQACSGIQISQDYAQGYDFSGLKSFTWKPNDDNEYGLKDNDLMDGRIRAAIVDTLSGKQYAPIDSGAPDFYISYHIVFEQKISNNTVSGGFSIGTSTRGSSGGIRIGTGTQIRAYDQRTILIDVTDPTSDKLIWRGISTQPDSEHTDPEESTQSINEAVEKILLQFPPQ